jgi:hypothetical protein
MKKKAVDPTKALKQEVVQLKKQLAALQKQVARLERIDDVTCKSLTVKNPKGDTVAEIDGHGMLTCREAYILPDDPRQKGIHLQGNEARIECLRVYILSPVQGVTKELIDIYGGAGSPWILMRDGMTDVVRLQVAMGQGSRLSMSNEKGKSGAMLIVAGDESTLTLNSPTVGQGMVELECVNGHNFSGTMRTVDRYGKQTAQIP